MDIILTSCDKSKIADIIPEKKIFIYKVRYGIILNSEVRRYSIERLKKSKRLKMYNTNLLLCAKRKKETIKINLSVFSFFFFFHLYL